MKNRSLKKAMAAALAVTMSLSLYTAPVFAEEAGSTEEAAAVDLAESTEVTEAEETVGRTSNSGVDGDIKWEWDGTTQTLTISSATGKPAAMKDYTYSGAGDPAPWGSEYGLDARWSDYVTKHIVIADDVTTIGKDAFAGYEMVEDIQLSKNLKLIGEDAFRWAGAKTGKTPEITLPDSLEKIDAKAFNTWEYMKEITIPKNVKELSRDAFPSCYSLENINVVEDNPYLCSVDGVVYDKAKTTLIVAPPVKESIEFPKTLTKLNSMILSGSGVSALKFTGDMPEIAQDAFQGSGFSGEGAYYHEFIGAYRGSTGYIRVCPDLTAYYPADNTTWAADKLLVPSGKEYEGQATYVNLGGGSVTWTPYGGTASTDTQTPDTSDSADITSAGIYVASQDGSGVVAGMVAEGTAADKEYRWLSYDINAGTWSVYQDWTKGSEWLQYNPGKAGDYLLQGEVRIAGHPDSAKTDCIGVNHHPNIKGKCQMPYTGEGGGYLIGVESYDNPDDSYSYELLVLDCTKYAAGDPNPWIYTTGQQQVNGNAFWTIWQPEYGYYWTLFRVYDKDGNMIDQDCYSFQNI